MKISEENVPECPAWFMRAQARRLVREAALTNVQKPAPEPLSEADAFWAHVRKCAEEVATWPEWMKAAGKLAACGYPEPKPDAAVPKPFMLTEYEEQEMNKARRASQGASAHSTAVLIGAVERALRAKR